MPLDNPVISCRVSLSSLFSFAVTLQRLFNPYWPQTANLDLPAAFSPAGVHHKHTFSTAIKHKENHLHQGNCHFLIKLLTQQIHQVLYFSQIDFYLTGLNLQNNYTSCPGLTFMYLKEELGPWCVKTALKQLSDSN